MKCPCCGAQEKTLVKLCQSCGEVFASQDLLELNQLEFLVTETADWNDIASRRLPYMQRLEALRERLGRFKQVEPKVEEAIPPAPAKPVPEPPLTAAVPTTAAKPVMKVAAPKPEAVAKPKTASVPKPTTPPKEKVPFDQWLLSERNIKIALYSGGLLLVLAGLIFIGVNWTRIPGPGKFAITMMVTGLMYLGGYLLFQRPAYRIGGVALLGVASGFLTLNFAVLQIYVLGPNGLRDDVMWLIASPFCLLLYAFTAYWTRSDLFTYLSLAAVASTTTAALVVSDAALMVYPLAYALLAYALLGLARFFQGTGLANFTRLPFLIVAQGAMPLIALAALTGWITFFGCENCLDGSPWLAIVTLVIAVLFYASSDYLFKWLVMRWAAVLLFPLVFSLILVELKILPSAILITLMIIPSIYLVASYLLERRGGKRAGSWPFYVASYGLAALISFIALVLQALGEFDVLFTLTTVLTGDVLLLVLTDVLFKRLEMRWGAAFLFPIPFTMALIDFNLGETALAITLMFLALTFLGVGYGLEWRGNRRSAGWPLYTAAYAIAIFVTLMAIPDSDDLWKVLIGDVVLLSVSAVIHRDYRWVYAAVWSFILPIYLIVDINVPVLYHQGLLMGALGLLYAVIAYVLGSRKLSLGGPFLTAAACLSVVAVVLTWGNPLVTSSVLAILAGLYLLLAFWIGWKWLIIPVYAPVWLLMISVYLLIEAYVPTPHYQGLLMGLLCLNYTAIGFLLGRRELRLGGPFLTAAVVLSVLVPSLTWGNPMITSLCLFVIAGLYLLIALWRNWTWLLFPVLLAMNLAVYTSNRMFLHPGTTIELSLIISFTVFGVVLTLGWLVLRRNQLENWGYPLVLVSTIDLAGAYIWGLTYGGWLSVSLSIVLAILLLSFAWLERATFTRLKFPPLLSYMGIGAIYIGQLYLVSAIAGKHTGDIWPGFTAGMCALSVFLAWILRSTHFSEIYAKPLRLAGLSLMSVPMAAALIIFDPVLGAVTFGIASTTYLGDAIMRRILNLAYVGICTALVTIWAALLTFDVTEPQAFIIPVGIALLGVGWYERVRIGGRLYRVFSILGLLVLLGSAFVQSIPRDAYMYAFLLLVECLVSITWGIRTHSRCFVQLGVVALVANAIVQLGPGFIDLPRWIQIGITGGLLLGGGLAALFKREELLAGRRRLTDEWRQWTP